MLSSAHQCFVAPRRELLPWNTGSLCAVLGRKAFYKCLENCRMAAANWKHDGGLERPQPESPETRIQGLFKSSCRGRSGLFVCFAKPLTFSLLTTHSPAALSRRPGVVCAVTRTRGACVPWAFWGSGEWGLVLKWVHSIKLSMFPRDIVLAVLLEEEKGRLLSLLMGKNAQLSYFFSNIIIEIGRELLFRKNFPYCSVNIFYGKLIFP